MSTFESHGTVFFYPPSTSEAEAADIRAFEQGYPLESPAIYGGDAISMIFQILL
jgi:hypothetical protein